MPNTGSQTQIKAELTMRGDQPVCDLAMRSTHYIAELHAYLTSDELAQLANKLFEILAQLRDAEGLGPGDARAYINRIIVLRGAQAQAAMQRLPPPETNRKGGD